MEDDLVGRKGLRKNKQNDKTKQSTTKSDVLIGKETRSKKIDAKEDSDQPEVHEDEESVDFLNSHSAELIVIDESGGEEEETQNGEIVEAEVEEGDGEKVADSDIEIVSDRATPMSTGSIDSIPYEGVNPCLCQGCPYKRNFHQARKKCRKVSKELKKMKRGNGFRVLDIGQSATVEIKFSDDSLFTKYAQELESFIKSITDVDRAKNSTSDSSDQIEPGCSFKLYDNFCVDRKGLKETPFHMEWRQPMYEQQFSEALTGTSFEETPTKNIIKRSNSCFNCMGEHMLAECPEPHDRQRIANSRNEHRLKRPNLNYSRYHVDDDNKYSKFRPGIISHELRRALGIEYCELPMFVYKMRLLGYPPGWLKEAEVHSSGITVYDSEGKAIGEQLEDGEVDGTQGIKVHYDADKMVAFPGFNVSPPMNTRDDSKRLGFPPIQQRHMNEFVEKTIHATRDSQAYKRKNVVPSPLAAKRPKASNESEDMDIEEIQTVLDDEPSCEFIAPETPTVEPRLTRVLSDGAEDSPRSSALKRVTSDSSTPCSSPGSKLASALSLEDLESAKQKLMVELNDSTSVEEGEVKTSATDTQSSDEDCITPRGKTFTALSKAMQLGSPAIYQANSYVQLPNAVKFSAGISEHLYFQNLPDSTGNFDKMRGVLQNLRERISSLKKQ